jgi:rhodanese-related sulfurtransferase
MRKYLFIFLTLSGLLGLANCQSPAESYQDLDSKEFAELSQRKGYVLLDVRTPEEYKTGRIGEAVLLDYSSNDFEQKASLLDKDTHYLVYCRSGKRSAAAAHWLSQQGYQVSNLRGGILSWEGVLEK